MCVSTCVESNGTRGTVTVTTGPRGTFEARFVIDELERTKDMRGTKGRIRYEVQAHILNASELAPTSSNVVRIG
jgi:hypothetical protein